ncbi:MAG TPA: deoxyribodipyrimidine photo-lyase, partial [Bryobacteraceae bacterium]|nr:deoxyribodipyrimidine photo-lyase [Bryobacteraceae bacterium]
MAADSIIGNMDGRVQLLNDARVRSKARYVLYWAQVNRRVAFNHGLAYAVELANRAGLPVLFYEGLTHDYPHASDRVSEFVADSAADNARDCARLGIGYRFYRRRGPKDANDLIYRLAENAAAIVTDDYPLWPCKRFNATVPAKIGIPYYTVDSSCVVPMSCFDKREYAAYTIRPKIRKLLPKYLRPFPRIRVRHRLSAKFPEVG